MASLIRLLHPARRALPRALTTASIVILRPAAVVSPVGRRYFSQTLSAKAEEKEEGEEDEEVAELTSEGITFEEDSDTSSPPRKPEPTPAIISALEVISRITPTPGDITAPSNPQLAYLRLLVEYGAPNPEELHENITRQEASAWIDRATPVTQVPATPGQWRRARWLINFGYAPEEKLRKGMRSVEMKAWLDAGAKKMKEKDEARRANPVLRAKPASEKQLRRAAYLAELSEPPIPLPWGEGAPTRGEAGDFIQRRGEELKSEGKLWLAGAPLPEQRDDPPSGRLVNAAKRLGIDPGRKTRGQLSDEVSEIKRVKERA
ncbi:hypothetical protein CALVIDRAFT_564739 [Calocera viscosa TUFC12733]|uniref:Uncharacterized protein n=1 Tax=Calocera viscosa (strain TUFC12733) TaxID=1330018 RepID=A0A167L4K2_CALVF|nr:hypothetical protein CALVIDRAFT_564739 [Calocera viscosa TUFC12733]